MFEVDGASLVDGPARLSDLSDTRAVVDVTGPGEVVVRVRESPYWVVTSGDACMVAGTDGWLHLHVAHPGPVTLDIRMEIASVVPGNDDRLCPGD